MNSSNDFLLSLYRHRAFCVNYLIKKTNCDREEAENIFIESVLDLQEKEIDLHQIKNIQSYLVVTSLNHWRKLYIKTKKRNEQNDQIRLYFYHYLPGFDEGEDESNNLESKHQQIDQAFQQLSEKCKQIISQFYLENKTMAEIAKHMGFNTALVAATVKYRCLNRLKKMIHTDQLNDN